MKKGRESGVFGTWEWIVIKNKLNMIPINKSDIWKLSASDFNQWRRENDLPKLMDFFSESLPYFSEWQKKHKLTNEIIISHDHTGDFFL